MKNNSLENTKCASSVIIYIWKMKLIAGTDIQQKMDSVISMII